MESVEQKRDDGQLMRYNNYELSVIKNTFAENDNLLFTLRKALLQGQLTDAEKEVIKNFVRGYGYAILKKELNPDVDFNSPLFQMSSMYLGLGGDMKEHSPEYSYPYILAKDLEVEYLTQQLEIMATGEKPKIIFSELLKRDRSDILECFVGITVWSFLLSAIDTHLNFLKVLAGAKAETIEDTQKRLKKNSNK